jgi:hypothetical protein
MKKNKIMKIIILILIIISFFSFYKINNLNYLKHNKIRKNIINHPEFLPKPETAKYTSFGFANLRADIYWLESIQYI